MASISLAPASAVGMTQASAFTFTKCLAKTPVLPQNSSTLSFDGLHCARKVGSVRRTDSSLKLKQVVRERVRRGNSGVVCAVGDVSSEGTNYLIAGAVAIAFIGTALPFIFSRKDTCPECGGAGFVRGQDSGGALKANAARKDQQQIVCRTCNGLGKIGQTDKV